MGATMAEKKLKFWNWFCHWHACCLLRYTRPREPTNERSSHQNAGFSILSFHKCYGGDTPTRSVAGLGALVPGVGIQTLVALNFSAVVAPQSLHLAQFSRQHHIYSVHDCLWLMWLWEILHFRKHSCKYKPCFLLFLFVCKHILDNACYISRGMGVRNVSDTKSETERLLRWQAVTYTVHCRHKSGNMSETIMTLLLQTPNRKWYTAYGIATFPMSLSDLQGR